MEAAIIGGIFTLLGAVPGAIALWYAKNANRLAADAQRLAKESNERSMLTQERERLVEIARLEERLKDAKARLARVPSDRRTRLHDVESERKARLVEAGYPESMVAGPLPNLPSAARQRAAIAMFVTPEMDATESRVNREAKSKSHHINEESQEEERILSNSVEALEKQLDALTSTKHAG